MWISPRTPSAMASQPMMGVPRVHRCLACASPPGAEQQKQRHGVGRDADGALDDRADARRRPSPASRHHSAALTTMASPTRLRPTPSRRCSGSSSRAVEPMRRTIAPSRWATPSQSARSPRPRARTAAPPDPAAIVRRDRATASCCCGLARAGRRRTSGLATGRAGSRALALRPRRGRRTGRHAPTLREGHTSPTRNTPLLGRRRPPPLGRDRSSGPLDSTGRQSRRTTRLGPPA